MRWLVFLGLASWRLAWAGPSNLWDAVSHSVNFTTLTRCIKAADPSIMEILTEVQVAHTLFAPTDEAFAALRSSTTAACPDASTATAFLKYLLSATAAASPYIGQAFVTLLGAPSSLFIYSINRDSRTPANLPDIRYVDNAHALTWEAVGDAKPVSYLVTIDAVLRPPPGNGSVWDVVAGDEALSRTAALINEHLPELRQTLSQLPKSPSSTQGQMTFFAPENDAWSALPSEYVARLESDPSLLLKLFQYHIVTTGTYPQSTTGRYFSEQLFVTTSLKPYQIYPSFWRASSSGLYLANQLGVRIPVKRLNGTVVIGDNSTVTKADLAAYNGVVHRVNAVLPLPGDILSVLSSPPYPLSAAGNFTTFTLLVNASSTLKAALADEGPYTVLVPTDMAFAAAIAAGRIPPLDELLSNQELVTSIAAYHVVASSSLLLFTPIDDNPYKDDFAENAAIRDYYGRPLHVNRISLGVKSRSVNHTAVLVSGARLYQCGDGNGWGRDCGSHPVPSNTFAISGQHTHVIHAIDSVMVPLPGPSLLDAIHADDDLSVFGTLLAKAPDVETLLNTTTSSLTSVFAPTNAALSTLQSGRSWIFADADAIAQLLRYHVLPNQLLYSSCLRTVMDGVEPTTVTQRVTSTAFDGLSVVLVNATGTSASSARLRSMYVNRMAVEWVDGSADNGVLHKLSGALVPDLLQVALAGGALTATVDQLESDMSTLKQTLQGRGPFTLFGPTDAAYGLTPGTCPSTPPQQLSEAQLTYHVSPGRVDIAQGSLGPVGPTTISVQSLAGPELLVANYSLTSTHYYVKAATGVFVNEAQVLSVPSGIAAINGVVYPIDSILTSPQADLMTTMRSDPDASPFAHLVMQAGLEAQLQGEGPFTVWAPSSRVLGAIYKAEKVFGDKAQLPHLMGYHIVSGRKVFTPALANVTCEKNVESFCQGPVQTTMQGQKLASQVVSRRQTFMSTPDSAFNAEVIKPNVHCSNGILHVIEGFLTYEGYRRPA